MNISYMGGIDFKETLSFFLNNSGILFVDKSLMDIIIVGDLN